MADKQKLPVQKFIEDITSGHFSEQKIMTKYALNFPQLIFVMGKLAERRRISFKRIVAMVRGYLDGNEFEKAEACIRIFQKYFFGIYGVQTILKALEHEFFMLKSHIEFQDKMNEKSISLRTFETEYPDFPLHSSVAASVKVLDHFMEQIGSTEKTSNKVLDHFDAHERLRLYPQHADLFDKRTILEATRLWHQISLYLFHQKSIKYFKIKSMMDVTTRDVCMHLDGVRLPVKQVLLKVIERNKIGRILPLINFPPLVDVENIPAEQKIEILMENEWYLPPFCENCRCQIFPC